MLIDTHAHLTSSSFSEDLDAVLKRAYDGGVRRIINIATSEEELEKGLTLEKQYPWIYNAGGVHPHDAKEWKEQILWYSQKKLVAIGETGLDYHYLHSSKEEQQASFKAHIQLAKERKLPLIIHCREAYPDLFSIFDEEKFLGNVVLHCFTGSLEEALEGVKRGFYISFSGIVTFKKSDSLREVVKAVDGEKILIETDAPYLAPQSQRGKRNEPIFVKEVAEMIAQIKNLSFDNFCEKINGNASQFFNI